MEASVNSIHDFVRLHSDAALNLIILTNLRFNGRELDEPSFSGVSTHTLTEINAEVVL